MLDGVAVWVSPLDGASTAASSPRNDLVKNCRVHPTHWLIYTQSVTLSSRQSLRSWLNAEASENIFFMSMTLSTGQ